MPNFFAVKHQGIGAMYGSLVDAAPPSGGHASSAGVFDRLGRRSSNHSRKVTSPGNVEIVYMNKIP